MKDGAGRGAYAASILIVEDELLIALEAERVLGEAGYCVVDAVPSAEAALRAVERFRPDLVLMDVRLAGEPDGVEAAVEIWRRFGVRSLFATGNPSTALSLRASPANAGGVLEKPYRECDLLQAVRRALSVGATPVAGSPPRDSQPLELASA